MIPNVEYQQYEMGKARAGASKVDVSVKTGETFWKAVADKVGEGVANTGAAAGDALKTIQAANQIRSAVDSGTVIAGPGATLRLKGAQVAQVLGFSGPEAVVNTRNTIQGLAKLALGARASLKGQGQISDFEGKALQKAEAGEIDDMTLPEIRAIADVADRGARQTVKRNQQNVDRMRKRPESAGIAEYLDVPEPPEYQGPKAITSDEEFNALPSGAVFIAPDGSHRRKP
jgi:hypothetical protein